jgi:nicotinate-nucleotide--dimethylbenzimidazole phosphoribosyltransferase
LNRDRARALQEKLDQKTKPLGSLGSIESLAIDIGRIQDTLSPLAQPAALLLFAGDHGIVAEGVSLYPQAVTAQMVANICSGGAASSVLARAHDVSLTVINVGVISELSISALSHVAYIDAHVQAGTANFMKTRAMTDAACAAAMEAGRDAVKRSAAPIVLIGEMGIGNTTSATALTAALLGCDVADVVGPGTGLAHQGVAHKTEVIRCALLLHAQAASNAKRDPVTLLACVGGLEIAAMVGAYLECAAQRKVILVDGFIASAALLAAIAHAPRVRDCCVFSHVSGEPGHQRILSSLNAKPLLNLGMRLGEGTGALMAYPLLKSACAIVNDMASFADSGVSGADAADASGRA